jgi:hypothetical protein
MLSDIPAKGGKDRDDWAMKAVLDGRADFSFSDVTSSDGTNTAVFRVFTDALKVDGVRVSVSATLQQRIADVTGCMLLTAKVADLAWVQRAVHVDPHPRMPTEHMADTDWMIDHSSKVDIDIAKLGSPVGLVGTVGKHWILDNAITASRAMNYGWHFTGQSFQGIPGEVVASLMKYPDGRSYYKLLQGRGGAHDPVHEDYSQTCVLMSRQMSFNGSEAEVRAVLADRATCGLGCHSGPLTIFRQPGVPEVEGILVMPVITVSVTA